MMPVVPATYFVPHFSQQPGMLLDFNGFIIFASIMNLLWILAITLFVLLEKLLLPYLLTTKIGSRFNDSYRATTSLYIDLRFHFSNLNNYSKS